MKSKIKKEKNNAQEKENKGTVGRGGEMGCAGMDGRMQEEEERKNQNKKKENKKRRERRREGNGQKEERKKLSKQGDGGGCGGGGRTEGERREIWVHGGNDEWYGASVCRWCMCSMVRMCWFDTQYSKRKKNDRVCRETTTESPLLFSSFFLSSSLLLPLFFTLLLSTSLLFVLSSRLPLHPATRMHKDPKSGMTRSEEKRRWLPDRERKKI